MITIDFIQKCIEDAENLKSKLPIHISQRPGLSSQKIRHFLNNICSFDGAKYLNIGLCSGSSYWSAIYHNNILATGIDWFRNDTNKWTEKEFWSNLSKIVDLETETVNRKIEVFNQDCFTVKLKDKYNIYLYDAGHSEENQYKALTYFYENLEDEFILLVDDFDDFNVKRGTIRAIQDLKCNIKFKEEKIGQFGNWNPDSLTWWNGFLICLINKK